MERLKAMKETLIGCVQTQLADIKNVDAHELGEAVDMIKDFEEAMYYCMKIKKIECELKEKEEEAKEKKEHKCHCKEKESKYYMMPYYPPYDRDMDRDMGRMYYSDRQPRNSRGEFISYYDGNRGTETSSSSSNRDTSNRGNMNYYHEREFPIEMRDEREGRSPMSRRMYMESKEMHKDKAQKIKELEKYMQELSEDIVEMIDDASTEEKQLLEKKMTHLTSKIAQLNQNG